MKPNLSHLFSGLAGGLLVLGAGYLLPSKSSVQAIEIKTETLAQAPEQTTEEQAPKVTGEMNQLAHNMGGTRAPIDFSTAAEKVMPAVVNVTSISRYTPSSRREERYMELFGRPRDNQSTGSGVILGKQGYIVTNNHVIEGATEIEVTLYDKRKYKAELVGTDPSTDLAVLKIQAPNLPSVALSNSDQIKIGEWVLAVGNPFDLNFTVTAGIVSAKGRNINILGNRKASIESFIQTDAAVNPGNSGGALVNADGELVGINTAIATPTGTYAGYSFAVPINLVKKVVGDLMEYGEVHRAYLGVMIMDVDSDFAKQEGLFVSQGVFVSELIEGGAAKDAGIKKGDVIVGINDQKVRSVNELQEKVGSRNPGDTVRVKVKRGKKELELNMKLKE
ncbi:trypsin-like peptidase domain-containing protein [Saprospira sp. CCB-QB6]|uniref:S1C family serine protease n=1 Tax=Saprospira sp. CCB-QB6 TaxID=3023936 RepID=UPI002349A8AA|nr:trypsin-like peptidase domain-containing protein [Saprospira sp. CCB-QB6]WCL82646.1 trypsin-like peptidase domain-containing protein [Saprospira sp. CCB-QB6]